MVWAIHWARVPTLLGWKTWPHEKGLPDGDALANGESAVTRNDKGHQLIEEIQKKPLQGWTPARGSRLRWDWRGPCTRHDGGDLHPECRGRSSAAFSQEVHMMCLSKRQAVVQQWIPGWWGTETVHPVSVHGDPGCRQSDRPDVHTSRSLACQNLV